MFCGGIGESNIAALVFDVTYRSHIALYKSDPLVLGRRAAETIECNFDFTKVSTGHLPEVFCVADINDTWVPWKPIDQCEKMAQSLSAYSINKKEL